MSLRTTFLFLFFVTLVCSIPAAAFTATFDGDGYVITGSGTLTMTKLKTTIGNTAVLDNSGSVWDVKQNISISGQDINFFINDTDATKIRLYAENDAGGSIDTSNCGWTEIDGVNFTSYNSSTGSFEIFSSSVEEIFRGSVTVGDCDVRNCVIYEIGRQAGSGTGTLWTAYCGFGVNASKSGSVVDNNTFYNNFMVTFYNCENAKFTNNTITKSSLFLTDGRGFELCGHDGYEDSRYNLIAYNNVTLPGTVACRVESGGEYNTFHDNHFEGGNGLEMYTRNRYFTFYNNTYIGSAYGSTSWSARYGGTNHMISNEYVSMTSGKSLAGLMITQNMVHDNITFSDVMVDYQSDNFVDDSYGHAVLVLSGTDIMFKNLSVSTTSETNAIRVSEDYYSTDVSFFNCTVNGSSVDQVVINDGADVTVNHSLFDGGNSVIDIRDTASAIIQNSILINGVDGIVSTSSGTVSSDYNCIYNMSNSSYVGTAQGTHDMLVDPLIDANYTLLADSPCSDNASDGGDIGLWHDLETSSTTSDDEILITVMLTSVVAATVYRFRSRIKTTVFGRFRS